MATRCILRATKEQIVACDPAKLRSELVGTLFRKCIFTHKTSSGKLGLDENETYGNDLRSIVYLTGEFDTTNQNIADIIIPVRLFTLSTFSYTSHRSSSTT